MADFRLGHGPLVLDLAGTTQLAETDPPPRAAVAVGDHGPGDPASDCGRREKAVDS